MDEITEAPEKYAVTLKDAACCCIDGQSDDHLATAEMPDEANCVYKTCSCSSNQGVRYSTFSNGTYHKLSVRPNFALTQLYTEISSGGNGKFYFRRMMLEIERHLALGLTLFLSMVFSSSFDKMLLQPSFFKLLCEVERVHTDSIEGVKVRFDTDPATADDRDDSSMASIAPSAVFASDYETYTVLKKDTMNSIMRLCRSLQCHYVDDMLYDNLYVLHENSNIAVYACIGWMNIHDRLNFLCMAILSLGVANGLRNLD